MKIVAHLMSDYRLRRANRAPDPVRNLSAEELHFLRCLISGLSQTAIAYELGILEAHALQVRETLMAKLGARCTADAVREGIDVTP